MLLFTDILTHSRKKVNNPHLTLVKNAPLTSHRAVYINSISISMISGSAQRSSTSWDMDSIIRAGGEDTAEGANEIKTGLPIEGPCNHLMSLTREHQTEEVAGGGQHHPVGREVLPLDHQDDVTEGPLGRTGSILNAGVTPSVLHNDGVVARAPTCFLRLFITPMMLESCLYSCLYSFLSLFFLEEVGFSGDATPVMSPTGVSRRRPVPTPAAPPSVGFVCYCSAAANTLASPRRATSRSRSKYF